MSDEISTDEGLSTEEAADAIADVRGAAPELEAKERPRETKPGSEAEAAERMTAREPEPEPEEYEERLPPPQPRMTPNEEVIAAKAELRAKANQINWERLRAENPGEYAAMFQEFKNAESQLLQYESNLAAHQQAQQQHMTQAQIAQAREHLATENRKLVEQIPGWQDDATREREVNQVRDYLATKGYTQEEIDGVASARDVKLVYDAMKAEQRPRRASRQAPQKNNVEREIEKRKLSPHSMDAGALRIEALLAR